jgi:hypothetical protein
MLCFFLSFFDPGFNHVLILLAFSPRTCALLNGHQGVESVNEELNGNELLLYHHHFAWEILLT